MRNPSTIGRIFYGIATIGLGFQTIYYKDLPYMLIPARHAWIPSLAIVAYTFGILLILAGASIVFAKKTKQVAFVLGIVLLLIFCFYFIPYQFMSLARYMHLVQWDNPGKELALSAGALVIAGSFGSQGPTRLARVGAVIFSMTMISFGIMHFVYASGVAEYIPSWISNRLAWAYIAGAALLGSGVAIFLNIKVRLFATLLGSMIFIWVIILHIPKSIADPFGGKGGEVSSGLIALAYSGTAFVIARLQLFRRAAAPPREK